MEMIIAIFLPIILIIIVASVVAIVLTANIDNNGKVRNGCCSSTNVETEDGPHVEAVADPEDEVIFAEIRYPIEKPQGVNQQVITLQNPLHAKSPKEESRRVTVEHDSPTHGEILQKPLNRIAESDEESTSIMCNNSSSNEIFNYINNSEKSYSNPTITNTSKREQLSSTASNITKTCLTVQTVVSDTDTSYNCKPSSDVSQSNSSAESITDEQLVPIVPNPAYNFKETYLAAQRVTLELNPAYNYKFSYTSGL